MIAFEIFVNGEKRCVAGAGEFGVLSGMVVSTHSKPKDAAPSARETYIEVGGLADGEHLKWISQALSPGDSVTFRVIDTAEVDAPDSRYRDDPASVAQRERRYYERLKKKYEETGSGDGGNG